jgi:ABC-2 type transport system ATP-binding protein
MAAADRRTGVSAANPAIVVRDLGKTYRNGVQALAGLSLTVQTGEIFGLLGPNGAGKSTTTRILATLCRPDSGQAMVAGRDVLGDPALVRRRIGLVAQASGVDKYATGRENLTLQAHIERVPRREVADRVDRMLRQVGLSDAADRLVQTYSGGMKRRLDLAMGLVHEPAVLFLDEPTTGLDPETRAALWRDLARLREERRLTVLLTTHYLDEADRLCDRLAIVDRGRVIVEGTPTELKAQVRGDAVTLHVNGSTSLALQTLQSVDGVLEVVGAGDTLIARVAHGATALPALVSTMERTGIGVVAATVSRPTLDDVYLHHTGHRFAANGEISP